MPGEKNETRLTLEFDLFTAPDIVNLGSRTNMCAKPAQLGKGLSKHRKIAVIFFIIPLEARMRNEVSSCMSCGAGWSLRGTHYCRRKRIFGDFTRGGRELGA